MAYFPPVLFACCYSTGALLLVVYPQPRDGADITCLPVDAHGLVPMKPCGDNIPPQNLISDSAFSTRFIMRSGCGLAGVS